jgi:hypothetical protein
MKKAKGKREPRLPVMTSLPATFAEAEAATIIDAIDHWYVKMEEKLKPWASDAGRLHMQNDLIQQLQTQSSLTIAQVIYMADAGHVPAINALRVHIGTHLDQGGKWEDLPGQLQGWCINKTSVGGGGATAGGWSKMSDEPLACEREPIERVRARLEAPSYGERCSPLRCSIQADRQALPSGSHAERPVQGSRRQEYWAADAGGPRAQQASKLETRGTIAPR